MGITLYVGGQTTNIQGEKEDLVGHRCWSAAHQAKRYHDGVDLKEVIGLLDSGAFSDRLEKRLHPEQALLRQLLWESRASKKWGGEWQCHAIASYDLLIDETWTGNHRVKRRWTVADAEMAVKETVTAAAYLASQRSYLSPRHLVLGCQGVDAEQYRRCVDRVLEYAAEGDWVGLGGYCIIGRFKSYLPVFYETLHQCIPLIAQGPIKHVHIYGVMYEKALAPLLWMAEQHNLTVSADSKRPIQDLTWKNLGNSKKAGVRHPYWRQNVQWWVDHLANMQQSNYYREPPRLHRQLCLFDWLQE